MKRTDSDHRIDIVVPTTIHGPIRCWRKQVQSPGFNTTLLVALSTADTNKWSTLLGKRHRTSELEVTAVDYERTGPILQRQRRLTDTQALMLGDRYSEGATVYQLAQEFSISRKTVSKRLKKEGVTMRRQSPGSKLNERLAWS